MVVCHSLDGQNVTDDQCQDLKPLDIQICDMGSCAQGWFHSPWSRKVSASQHVLIYNPCAQGWFQSPRSRKVSASQHVLIYNPCAQGWFHHPMSRKVSASQHVMIYNPCAQGWFHRPMSKKGERLTTCVDL